MAPAICGIISCDVSGGAGAIGAGGIGATGAMGATGGTRAGGGRPGA